MGKNIELQLNLPRQIEQIESLGPSIIAMQEVREQHAQILQEQLPHLSETVYFRPDHRGYGNIIMSRFPILDTRAVVYRSTSRDDPRTRGAVAAKFDLSSLFLSNQLQKEEEIQIQKEEDIQIQKEEDIQIQTEKPSEKDKKRENQSENGTEKEKEEQREIQFQKKEKEKENHRENERESEEKAKDEPMSIWFITTHFGSSMWMAQQTGQALELLDFTNRIEKICKADKKCLGVMLGGDFNSPSFSVPAHLLFTYFYDQFHRLRTVGQLFGLTSGTGPISWHIQRIDYLFSSHLTFFDTLPCKNIHLVPSLESDHFALVLQYFLSTKQNSDLC